MKTNQKGQVIIVLLLTILVGLSIGLVVTQKTVTDVTTSTQTEQSSRAFSVAEAGIERALSGDLTSVTVADTENESNAVIKSIENLPNPHQALEYQNKINKEDTAQFWLSNMDLNPYYPQDRDLFLYFGNIDEPESKNIPAVETILITKDGSNFTAKREYFDANPARTVNNLFAQSCTVNQQIPTTNSKTTTDLRPFRCRVKIRTLPTGIPIMLRARILYSDTPQPIALSPDTKPPDPRSLPPQLTRYYSTGRAGQSQKIITATKHTNILPSLLDYAVFSNSSIVK